MWKGPSLKAREAVARLEPLVMSQASSCGRSLCQALDQALDHWPNPRQLAMLLKADLKGDSPFPL